MILVHKDTGIPVVEGELVTDRHDSTFAISSWSEPKGSGNPGWVSVDLPGLGPTAFSPGIFGLEFRPEATKGGKV